MLASAVGDHRGSWVLGLRPPHSPAPPLPGSPGSTCLASPALASDEDALVPVAVAQRAVGVIGDGVAADEEGSKGFGGSRAPAAAVRPPRVGSPNLLVGTVGSPAHIWGLTAKKLQS